MKAFKAALIAFTLTAAAQAQQYLQPQVLTTPTGQPLVQQVQIPGQSVTTQSYVVGEQSAYNSRMANNCSVGRNDKTTIVVGDGDTSGGGSKRRKKNH